MTAVSPSALTATVTLAPPIFVQRGATLAPTPPRPTVASRRHSCSSTYLRPLALRRPRSTHARRCQPAGSFGAAAGDVLGQRLTEGMISRHPKTVQGQAARPARAREFGSAWTATRRPHRRRRRDGARFPSRLGAEPPGWVQTDLLPGQSAEDVAAQASAIANTSRYPRFG
jgi:hypothetical protein